MHYGFVYMYVQVYAQYMDIHVIELGWCYSFV